MSLPIFYGPNRLRTAVVSSTTSPPDAALPRLWDGFAGPLWQGTGPIVVDQGVAPALQFNTTIIATGHNLGGATLTVQTDDNVGFTSAITLGTGVAPATVAMVIPCTGTVERYTRVTFSGAPATLQIGELMLAPSLTAPRPPTLLSSPNRLPNIVGYDTEAGVWLASVRGQNRWAADWIIQLFPRTLRTQFMTWLDDIHGGADPCYVLDDEGLLRFTQVVTLTFTGGALPQNYDAHIVLREALG